MALPLTKEVIFQTIEWLPNTLIDLVLSFRGEIQYEIIQLVPRIRGLSFDRESFLVMVDSEGSLQQVNLQTTQIRVYSLFRNMPSTSINPIVSFERSEKEILEIGFQKGPDLLYLQHEDGTTTSYGVRGVTWDRRQRIFPSKLGLIVKPRNGEPAYPLFTPHPVHLLAPHPEGEMIAFASGLSSGHYELAGVWKRSPPLVTSEEMKHRFLNHYQKEISLPYLHWDWEDLKWSPDGEYLAAGHTVSGLQIWRPRSHEFVVGEKEITDFKASVKLLQWRGRYLVGRGISHLFLWHVADNSLTLLWRSPWQEGDYTPTLDLDLTARGARVAWATRQGKVYVAEIPIKE